MKSKSSKYLEEIHGNVQAFLNSQFRQHLSNEKFGGAYIVKNAGVLFGTLNWFTADRVFIGCVEMIWQK